MDSVFFVFLVAGGLLFAVLFFAMKNKAARGADAQAEAERLKAAVLDKVSQSSSGTNPAAPVEIEILSDIQLELAKMNRQLASTHSRIGWIIFLLVLPLILGLVGIVVVNAG